MDLKKFGGEYAWCGESRGVKSADGCMRGWCYLCIRLRDPDNTAETFKNALCEAKAYAGICNKVLLIIINKWNK